MAAAAAIDISSGVEFAKAEKAAKTLHNAVCDLSGSIQKLEKMKQMLELTIEEIQSGDKTAKTKKEKEDREEGVKDLQDQVNGHWDGVRKAHAELAKAVGSKLAPPALPSKPATKKDAEAFKVKTSQFHDGIQDAWTQHDEKSKDAVLSGVLELKDATAQQFSMLKGIAGQAQDLLSNMEKGFKEVTSKVGDIENVIKNLKESASGGKAYDPKVLDDILALCNATKISVDETKETQKTVKSQLRKMDGELSATLTNIETKLDAVKK